ncbi:MAG: N-acetyltransferase family protein [Pseudomonadota bacterium]
MRFVSCTHEEHAGQMLDILNEAIVNSTVLYDYLPRPPESMVSWFGAKEAGRFPVIGVEDHTGTLMGFATYGSFRAWPAYKYSVENALYIHKDHRRKGLGLMLMQRLIEAAGEQQYHSLIAGISMDNPASISLHEKLGFAHAGTIRQAGLKFGQWLDLGFYQLLLETPAEPVDG